MRVFAHYSKFESQAGKLYEYRWRTLLQFGTSWEVIGSIVMVNPGTSSPLTPDQPIKDDELLRHLHLFDSDDNWYEYTDDPTLRFVRTLFRMYQETQYGNSELNGVIQVFNLLNIRESNLKEALEKNQEVVHPFSKTVDKDITQLIAPVYLGWGKSMKNIPYLREDEEKFFNVVYNEMDGKYLHADFNKNNFYHPQYMMGRGRNRHCSKYLLQAFCQNTTTPSM